MRLLVKLPSRSRPTKLYETLIKYVDYAEDLSNIQFLISLDSNDSTVDDILLEKLRSITNCTVCVGVSASKIDACNRDMDKVSEYDIILLASDDMIPVKKGYDNIIRTCMNNYFPDTDGVLWFNDGYRGKQLNTLSILGKKYYERFGYIYYPEYKSFYCDDEFTAVSANLGKYIYFNEVIIKHEHPTNINGQLDELYIQNNAHWDHDRILFNRRMGQSYPKRITIPNIIFNPK